MRFELAGVLIPPEPIVLTFNQTGTFDLPYYLGLGYTDFDVICIGGGGGRGGGIKTNNTGTLVRSYGGAGGGGGFHRVQGKLAALPYLDEVKPVAVGAGGTLGLDHVSNPALTTDGGVGGPSTFATNVCRASGGEGGHHVETNSLTIGTAADGGFGGIGGTAFGFGAAEGGGAGVPSATEPDAIPSTPGLDGQIYYDVSIIGETIGEGGGGGAGGVGKYGSGGIIYNAASAGGRGAYNPSELGIFGSGTPPSDDPDSGADTIVPGSAGGAKATPLNSLPYIYGQSCQSNAPLTEESTQSDISKLGRGVVIVRLTVQT